MPIHVQTLERQNLVEVINALSDSAIEKLVNYADFLRYEEKMEELEEAEDIAAIEARKDEPTVPLNEVIARHEAKLGMIAWDSQLQYHLDVLEKRWRERRTPTRLRLDDLQRDAGGMIYGIHNHDSRAIGIPPLERL